MKIPARDAAVTGGAMTPLIDVVFLLIIFFLVSSHLARRENHLPVELPIADSSNLADVQKERFTITIQSDGQLHAAGRTMSLAELGPAFLDHHKTAGDDAAVRIRCDAAVAYGDVSPVLWSAAEHGCVDITVATIRQSMASRPTESR